MTHDPAALFRRHGLDPSGLRPASAGYVNRVWLADSAVLRVGPADHGRESHVALGALAAGVRTARPLAWGEGYSLWERLPGEHADLFTLSTAVWDEVLDDLERLHAHPPEPRVARTSNLWTGEPGTVGETAAEWSPAEERRLLDLLSTPYPLSAPVFVHADVYSHNVLVHQGRYSGLIDWGNAGWATLEHEVATMDDPGPALARWGERLAPGLLWRLRLNLLLKVARDGRIGFGRVRQVLDLLTR